MSNLLSQSFSIFNRKEWANFRKLAPKTLSRSEIFHIKKINNNLSIHEITEIYVPLSKLLNLHIRSASTQQKAPTQLININHTQKIPYIIGITGSVASGKSTTAKILQTLFSILWPKHHVVELVTTDGFLYSNKTLKKKI